ncbi:RNA polymerase Rpb7-like protein [Aduncisulcus paluster]|uniref:RNA polymerase Rpb7-like protein n=1 Tax=Aduncisulcus paluster TaxID=2918883 RepID=A0ABQ5KJQ2_9EUKA|nr:RNA polymerase Rpb7-like protein [Aduncisulcus paluster]
MYYIVEMEDVFKIPPTKFALHRGDSCESEINSMYVDKILPYKGLSIGLEHLHSIGDEIIPHGEGGSHTKLSFSLLVYKPVVGEVFKACITHSIKDKGVYLTSGLIHNIFVSVTHLPQPCHWSDEYKGFVWEVSGNDVPIEPDVDVLVKVADVIFRDPSSKPPTLMKDMLQKVKGSKEEPTEDKKAEGHYINEDSEEEEEEEEEDDGLSSLDNPIERWRDAPIAIIARMDTPGLGDQTWWV